MNASVAKYYRPIIAAFLENGIVPPKEGLPHYIIDRRCTDPDRYTFIRDKNIIVIARAADMETYEKLKSAKNGCRCTLIALSPLDVLSYDIMPTTVDKYGNVTDDKIRQLMMTEVANFTIFDELIPEDELKVDKGCITYIRAKNQYPKYSWNHFDNLMVYSGIENYVNFKCLKQGSFVRYIPFANYDFMLVRKCPPFHHDHRGLMLRVEANRTYLEKLYYLGVFLKKEDDETIYDEYSFSFKGYSGYERLVDSNGIQSSYAPLSTRIGVMEDSDYTWHFSKPYGNVESFKSPLDISDRTATNHYCTRSGLLASDDEVTTTEKSYMGFGIYGYFYNVGTHLTRDGRDFSLTSFCRNVGRGVYVTRDNIKEVAPLFCAACCGPVFRYNWEFFGYHKSLPKDNSYLEDKEFCLYCILYMVLSPWNNTRSYWLPELYRTDLSLDGYSPIHLTLGALGVDYSHNAPYVTMVNLMEDCLNSLDRYDEYDDEYRYNYSQIMTDINTFHHVDSWDIDNSNHPELHNALINIESATNDFLLRHIKPKLLKYGFLT